MVAATKELPQEDYDKVIKQWNSATLDVPNVCLHDLIVEAAKKYPDSVAMKFENSSVELTFKEVDMMSNHIANKLRATGVKPDDLVGVCLSRGVMMLVTMIGILKSGAAYVALDPKFPHDRLAYICEEAAISTVMVEEELGEFVDAFIELISRKETSKDVKTEKNGNLVTTITTTVVKETSFSVNKFFVEEFENPPPAGQENEDKYIYHRVEMSNNSLAYAIYTSGSTGKPKGVLLEHRTVVNFLLSMQQSPGFGPGRTLLAVTTICFDISVLELFLPVISGGKVVIVGSQTSRDGVGLLQLLKQTSPEIMQATPATWDLLLESGWTGDKNIKVLCGGEPMSVNLGNKLIPIVGELWNMYGPTEVTVWCTIKHLTKKLEGPPSIGKPIHNTTAYILDRETLKPVAVGEQGELYLGGKQCARGYHKKPDITAERFIDDPFSEDPEAKMYKSGDLARWTEDGDLICCGRADYQVKINGFRIELGEIETALDKHQSMSKNVVMAIEVGGSLQLVAYIVLLENQELDVQALQNHVEKQCTAYMVPQIFIQLKSLPLLPNGKVDRNSLPKPDEARATMASSIVEEPSTDVETNLVAKCCEILGTSPISVSVNLFTIGGNSLFAVKLHNYIDITYEVKVPVARILQRRNIKMIAEDIEVALNPNAKVEVNENPIIVPLQTTGSQPPLFLFHPAGGFLFPYFNLLTHLGSNQPVYGFQDPSLTDGDYEMCTSIEEMGAQYSKALLEFYPTGPIYVGGWSMGGYLALEVATNCIAAGREVPLLVIIDQVPKEGKFNKATFWMDNIFKGGELTKQQIALKYERLKGTNSFFRRGVYGFAHFLLGSDEAAVPGGEGSLLEGGNVSGLADPSAAKSVEALHQHMRMTSQYVPKNYHNNCVVYRCRDGENINQFIQWKNIIPQCSINDVSGSHFTVMTEPFVKELAARLDGAITEARYMNTNIPRETRSQSTDVLGYGEMDQYIGNSVTYQMGYASGNRKLSAVGTLLSLVKKKGHVDAPEIETKWDSFTLLYHWPDVAESDQKETILVHHKDTDLVKMKSKAKKSQCKYLVQEEIVILRGSIVACVANLSAPNGVEGMKIVMDVSVGDYGSLLSKTIASQEIEFGDLKPQEDMHHLRFVVFQTAAGDVVKMPKGKYNVMIQIFDGVGHLLYRMLAPVVIKDPGTPSLASIVDQPKSRDSLQKPKSKESLK